MFRNSAQDNKTKHFIKQIQILVELLETFDLQPQVFEAFLSYSSFRVFNDFFIKAVLAGQ